MQIVCPPPPSSDLMLQGRMFFCVKQLDDHRTLAVCNITRVACSLCWLLSVDHALVHDMKSASSFVTEANNVAGRCHAVQQFQT